MGKAGLDPAFLFQRGLFQGKANQVGLTFYPQFPFDIQAMCFNGAYA
jgi:hypothetical protein